MNNTITRIENNPSHVLLGEHLNDDYLQLPLAVLNGIGNRGKPFRIGPAALTLAALFRLCNAKGESFHTLEAIAQTAFRSMSGVKRDLIELESRGVLKNIGRGKFRNTNKKRRTNTIVLAEKAMKTRRPYLQLPRAVCHNLTAWSDRVFFAAIVSRYMLMERVSAQGHREQYSIRALAKDTGLARNSVMDAKQRLVERGFVNLIEGTTYQTENGRLIGAPDEITINEDLVIEL